MKLTLDKLNDLIIFWLVIFVSVGAVILLLFASLGSLLGWNFNMATLGLPG